MKVCSHQAAANTKPKRISWQMQQVKKCTYGKCSLSFSVNETPKQSIPIMIKDHMREKSLYVRLTRIVMSISEYRTFRYKHTYTTPS